MKTFEEIKEAILNKTQGIDTYKSELYKIHEAKTVEELLQFVKDNLLHAYDNINAEFLEENFGVNFLRKNYVFTSGKYSISLHGKFAQIFTLGEASVTINAWIDSSVRVKTLDNSSVIVSTMNYSSANIETWNSSSANVVTYGKSYANVKAYGSSSSNVETLDYSSANVETWGANSKITLKVTGENSFIRHHNERKIYIKKDNFEIVEV